jgi:WD40 repeat protein
MDTRAERSGGGAAAPPMLQQGAMVGDFRVERLLGRGGMGEVWLARDVRLGRKVALKLIQPHLLGSAEAAERFLQEARTTARFSHPHIVSVYAAGEHQGMPFVALEHVEGPSLAARLREGRPGERQALRMMLEVSEAVCEAHAHGIIHRDLKPANVVIGKDGRLRVVDFGLAKELPPDAAMSEGTLTGAAGTPPYMAPEQWRRERPSGATDVWALGVMLFELVAARLPFPSLSLARLQATVCSDDPAPRLSASGDADGRVVELVARCLHKDAHGRPTALELRDGLRRILDSGDGHDEAPPFRGLAAFGERDAAIFFGREREVARAVERLRREPMLAVVGPSGVGKSSFVLAGVIPRLREDHPCVVLKLRPTNRPLLNLARQLLHGDSQASSPPAVGTSDVASLAAALRRTPQRLGGELRALAARHGAQLLLFVDQLEELVTQVDDREERDCFMEAITSAADDAVDPIRVVTTARDDFLGRLPGDAFSQVMVLTQPAEDALRRMLLGPLVARGYRFEDDALVTEMVAAVRGEHASLPLLQFAAEALWAGRDEQRRVITRARYQAIGGVAGALAQHADGVLAGLTPQQMLLAKPLLLRLITAEGTRRLVSRSDVMSGLDDAAEHVLRRLSEARLLTSMRTRDDPGAEPVLELAHESLIHSWRALARWIHDGQEQLAFVTELDQTAVLWSKRGRQATELWRGAALGEARRQLERHQPELATLARAFIDESLERETHRARWRRLLAVGSVALCVVAAIVFALQASRLRASNERVRLEQTETEAQRAEAQHRRAEALREAARAAYVEGDVLEARAKLRMTLELEDAADARTLWWQLRGDPQVWRLEMSAIPYELAFSPDSSQLAIASQSRVVYLSDTRTRELRVLRGHGDQVFAVSFSPDGEILASGSWSGSIRLWDARSGEPRGEIDHGAQLRTLQFHPDGQRLLAAGPDGVIRTWDRSGAPGPSYRGHRGTVADLCFSADGTRFASVSEDDTTRIWPTGGGEPLVIEGPATDVTLSHDGRRLATASSERPANEVVLRSAEDGSVVRRFGLGKVQAVDVAFSADDRTLFVAGSDHQVSVFDLDGSRRASLRATTDVRALALSRDNSMLAAACHDEVRLWRTTVTPRARPTSGHGAAVRGLAFSADGKQLISGGWDQRVRSWDVSSGEQLEVIERDKRVEAVDYDPQGGRFAAASREIGVWDARDGRPLALLAGHAREVLDIAFSPSGGQLASTSADETVRLWDLRDASSRSLDHEGSRLRGLDFDPRGTHLAAGSDDGVVRLWDVASGRVVQRLKGHQDQVRGVRFIDEHRVVSGSWDRTVRLWDAASARQLDVLGPLPGRVLFLDADRDGRIGIPASDGVARIWDPRDGSVRELRGHRDEVNFFRFSRDGELAATSSDDGTVRLWRVADGVPMWRTPMLHRSLLLSHRGWRDLDNADAQPPVASWRASVEERARFAERAGDGTLCLQRFDGRVELWKHGAPELVLVSGTSARRVAALDGACALVGDDGALDILGREPARVTLDAPVDALGSRGATLLIAAGGQLTQLEPDGTRHRRKGARGASAIGWLDDGTLAIGFRDGSLELFGDAVPPFAPLELTPPSPVERIIGGRLGTVVMGFADGTVGMWQLATGARLERARLHGAVVHLGKHGQRVYAASELGESLRWDLRFLEQPRCELLNEVWSDIDVVWDNGRAVVAGETRHHCRER